MCDVMCSRALVCKGALLWRSALRVTIFLASLQQVDMASCEGKACREQRSKLINACRSKGNNLRSCWSPALAAWQASQSALNRAADPVFSRPSRTQVELKAKPLRRSTQNVVPSSVARVTPAVALAPLRPPEGCSSSTTIIGWCPSKLTNYIPSHEADPFVRKAPAQPLSCKLPPPDGYKRHVPYPQSLSKVWSSNVPLAEQLAELKGGQGWLRLEKPYAHFIGGGTHFTGKDGAVQYAKDIARIVPALRQGRVRSVLDMGAGVASFSASLLPYKAITFSYAPADQHVNQMQFVAERGLPGVVLALMENRLPLPAHSFDFIHCSRCRQFGNLHEIQRLLRVGGFAMLSNPAHRLKATDTEVQQKLCWRKVGSFKTSIIWQKRTCDRVAQQCGVGEEKLMNEGWNVKQNTLCMFTKPYTKELSPWPKRLEQPPQSGRAPALRSNVSVGLVAEDVQVWQNTLREYEVQGGFAFGNGSFQNILDCTSSGGTGGLAAALAKQESVSWVMNVEPVSTRPFTSSNHTKRGGSFLPWLYDRGLLGLYHNWCEDFPAYPRSYDVIHAVDLLSFPMECNLSVTVIELDRLLRPGGKVIISDNAQLLSESVATFCSVGWRQIAKYSPSDSGKYHSSLLKWRWTDFGHSSQPHMQTRHVYIYEKD